MALGLFPRVGQAAKLTTTATEAAGTDWTAVIWQTNGTGTSVGPPVAGNTYQCAPNGTPFGNAQNNTRIRNPTVPGLVNFPGDSLTLNTNTELRMKMASAGQPILGFPGVGANPGLILNGGVLNVGDDTVFTLTGKVQVVSQSYVAPADAGGGVVEQLRGITMAGQLSGGGTLVIFQAGTTMPQQFSGNSNTFFGPWVVKAGWLLASGLNSLGTNSITINPGYTLPLDSSIINTVGPAWLELGYDLNSAGSLTLTNGGVMILHQNCVFSAVKIEGTALSRGTHYFSELSANFPNNFASGGSGSLTVQPYGAPPAFAPQITTQPLSATLYAGSTTQLVAVASGAIPLTYQWQKGTNGVYVNLGDSGDVSGSKANSLTFSALALFDSADYRLVVTNAAGATTSQVATLAVVATDATYPVIATLGPTAGATVSNLTQIQVTFSEMVVGVEAEDLEVDGAPVGVVSGSGSNYVFIFTQPPAGTVQITWAVGSGITDLSGNSFDRSAAWTYNLLDDIRPALLSAAPAAGATVDRLTQVQVIFTKPVAGVTASAFLINGQPATNVAGSGFGPYLFQFAQPAMGPVQFSWAAGQTIRDGASNLFVPTNWAVTLNPATASALTNLVINEFLAANVSANGLADEDGQLSDWIELFNRGSTAVNLCGWSLTDSADTPSEWTFPATNIAAGHYLVVFASGKDRRVPGANLHTNFKLSSVGSYLGLYSSDSPPTVAHEYAPQYPEQRNDISYGLDSTNGHKYFAAQTPGGPNSSSTLNGIAAPVRMSVPHGFFNQAFNLLLTTETQSAAIVYTTNGSAPTVSGDVTNGLLYTGPVPISRTTPVRAAAFAPGLLPTLVSSQTYLFPEDIVHQPNNPPGYPTGYAWTPTPGEVAGGTLAAYQMNPTMVGDPQYSNAVRVGLVSIPSMSIMTPIDNLFDPVNGIYIQSVDHSLEVPCSMELLYPDGAPGLQQDCGLQMQGGASRQPEKTPKHSFRVDFKSGYGPKTLAYPFFADSPVQSFKTLVLDAGYNYWWHYEGGVNPTDQRYRAQCVRDQFISDLTLALGSPSFHGQFYHVYLNGLYWGLHYIHERPDDDFAASYFGGDNTDYDVIKNTSDDLQVVAGDLTAWNATMALSNTGLTNNAQYLQLQQYVDIDNLIDYMIVNHWGGNDDWPQHNWYAIRNRTTADGFKFMIWDAEQVLKSLTENVTTVNAAGSPAQIYIALLGNAEFRLRFADHLQREFFNGGIFYTDPNPVNAVWNPAHPERNPAAAYYMRRITEITNAIVDESARWGGYTPGTNYTRNYQWLLELNNLLGFTNTPANTANYFPQRSATVLNQYRTIGLFPSVPAPGFSQLGGSVPFGYALTLTNLNSAGKIYYTTNGADPRSFGSGAVAPGALPYSGAPLVLTAGMVVRARVLNGTWSPLTEATFAVASLGIPIAITELMYNPVGGKQYEFLELQNLGSVSVDISGFSFSGITYIFPSGSAIGPAEVMVLASGANPSAWANRYPGVVPAGYYSGALDNSGERIALLDQNGNTVTSVTYSPTNGWPTAADGAGYSLEVINPVGDPNDPANWRASTVVNGSPGVVNTTQPTPLVCFNEIMAENGGAVVNGGTHPDWLELYNPGSKAVNMANWSLSKSGDPRQFVFPSGTALGPGAYLVVWCDSDTNSPGLHAGFNLGRKGENLFLYDAMTNRVDALSFGLQLTNYSVGRVGSSENWQLTLPTPGSNNVAAPVASATNLVVNEWLANPPPGGSDWLELYNGGNLPVPLYDVYLGTSNELYQLRSQSFIAPHDFVQLLADKSPGADHLDFKLAAAGDAIRLYNSTAQLVDSVNFVTQLQGVSAGRLPDGSTNIVSFPTTASPGAPNYLSAYTGPLLNEIMAKNVSTLYDANGHTPDWLELYNPTATGFNLAGMSLGTDPGKPGQWTFPAGSSVAGSGFLVIYCDGSRPSSTNVQPTLNTGFSLSASGDAVYLFTTNGQVADGVAFGFQVADLSLGRTASGWSLSSAPTPGAANATNALLGNPANLRFNEWMANPASGNDWFELYNTDPAPVSLAGLYLTDDPSITGVTNTQVSALSFIAGYGWTLFQADSHPSQGADHVRFSLNPDGECLRLYNPNLVLIDAVDFGLQAVGVSQGRIPDGGSLILSFNRTPTPGTSNQANDTDGDGIPDWWTLLYFGHATGSAADKTRAQDDYDGDGMSNLAEYLAGTDPTDPRSDLKINSITPVSSGITLHFTVVAGHSYTLQYSASLSGPWQRLADVQTASATGSQAATDTTAGQRTRFYRLVTPRLP